MCGRYTFFDVSKLYERFGVNEHIEGLTARYNAAPGNMMPVIIEEQGRIAKLMRWGLIPSWAKDPRIGYNMINARIETVATKPSYRKPFKSQRCLIPANGFYEWKRENGKQPFYFSRNDKQLMAFAGLYDTWIDAEDMSIPSFTILTKEADATVKNVHTRMPVILSESAEAQWLKPDNPLETLLDIIKETHVPLTSHPVSNEVNSAKNDTDSLIYPINSS